jgi:membrane-associated phospholipid phosphatase
VTDGRRRLIAAVALIGAAVFTVLTILVSTGDTHGLDTSAFDAIDHVRAPWLDRTAKVITNLGLLVFVGPAVLLAAAALFRAGRRGRAVALVLGATLTWAGVWITKWAVDRPRPAAPLVHTAGQSFPSGHAANSVGWFALGLALTVLLSSRGARVAIVTAGALLALLVGLSRIYLRAHYISDVIAGEALAITMYSVCVLAVSRHVTRIG